MTSSTNRDRILLVHLPLYTFGPRVTRVEFVRRALESTWNVFKWPPHAPARSTATPARPGRSAARYLAETVLLDKFEPRCRRNVVKIPADVRGGLLVGPPFSPVAVAAGALARRGVPYVIDAGDPWALTAADESSRRAGRWRQRHAEYRMWEQAAGAILTTQGQVDDLREMFPNLPVLIRPNGYERTPSTTSEAHRTSALGTLRLVYYGNFYASHNPLRLRNLCRQLLSSGHWERLTFTHYGRDLNGTRDTLPTEVQVTQRPPIPWREVIAEAPNYDLALIVGPRNPRQLPSKAVAYLTLPIPRLALSESPQDALAGYVGDKPAYLVALPDEPDVADRVARHVNHGWTPEELAPPPAEAWEAVAPRIASFVGEKIGRSVELGRPVEQV